MMVMTSSRFKNTTRYPSRTSSLRSILPKRYLLRRIRTFRRCKSHSVSASLSDNTDGRPLLSNTFKFSETRISSSVNLNRLSITAFGSSRRDLGSKTTRISSADSSRISARTGSFLACSISAIFSISLDF